MKQGKELSTSMYANFCFSGLEQSCIREGRFLAQQVAQMQGRLMHKVEN